VAGHQGNPVQLWCSSRDLCDLLCDLCDLCSALLQQQASALWEASHSLPAMCSSLLRLKPLAAVALCCHVFLWVVAHFFCSTAHWPRCRAHLTGQVCSCTRTTTGAQTSSKAWLRCWLWALHSRVSTASAVIRRGSVSPPQALSSYSQRPRQTWIGWSSQRRFQSSACLGQPTAD
jgi:hypothetical protein